MLSDCRDSQEKCNLNDIMIQIKQLFYKFRPEIPHRVETCTIIGTDKASLTTAVISGIRSQKYTLRD
jgi:hypothetical protein